MEETNKQSKLHLLFHYIDILYVLNTIVDTDIDEECALELVKEVNVSKVIFIIVKNLYKKKLTEKADMVEHISNSIRDKIDILKELKQ